MKPASFRYVRAANVDECLALIAEHGDDAKILAGGQSLVPLMNLRLARPEWIVDINHVPDLSYIKLDGDVLRIGATTRHRDVATSETVAKACPLLAQATVLVGYPAIRNRGTIGGSVAHADPAAEIPCVACATDAEIVAVGPGGRRTIPARDFFAGYFTTTLTPAELLIEVRFPAFPAAGSRQAWSFLEFTRKSGDFAVADVAVGVAVAGGSVTDARIAIGGVTDRPWRATDAEELLSGRELSDDQIQQASELVLERATAEADGDGSSAELATVLAARALRSAAGQARETS